ncbi:MAG: AGE family epimerase/isomerase [Planctomyces sp.]|nr:AGE family epimerase/isomerase [Planctomyces sp.]
MTADNPAGRPQVPTFDFSKIELARLRDYYTNELNRCIRFWFPRSIDQEFGGFLHFFDRSGQLIDSDKSVWAQGRMSWMLLALYQTREQNEDWLNWAENGLNFIQRHCIDSDGRLFFHMTREGAPLRKRRYAYSESFAAIAYARHAAITGSSQSAERAIELFRQFTSINFEAGRMEPKYTSIRPSIGLAPRMITLVTGQELRRQLGNSELIQSWIDRCVGEILDLFVHPEHACVFETVSPDGQIIDHVDGRTLNPGHAIEGAWFIMQEGKEQNSDELITQGCQMLDWMWKRGLDDQHGGLFYFRDAFGKPVQEYWHDMKFWWPHNEALIATLLAWQLTKDSKYAQWHCELLEWCQTHFADSHHGEWYGYLHRDGSVANDSKGNLWKSFFHLPRALWICESLCEESLECL